MSYKKVKLILCLTISASLAACFNFASDKSISSSSLANNISDYAIDNSFNSSQMDDCKNKYYENVVIIGIDGGGGFLEKAYTPCFDSIFKNGSITYNGMSQNVSLSGQNWASMFLGVKSELHGLTNENLKDNVNTGSPYPTFFFIHSAYHKESTYFSAVHWPLINNGIIEDNISGMTKINASDISNFPSAFQTDDFIIDLAVKRVKEHRDSITFLHLENVDVIGHAFGSDSEEFLSAINYADCQLGRVYEAYKSESLLDKTLFVVVTDHGHTPTGGHGGNSNEEMRTTLALSGRINIANCGSPKDYKTDDLAPIILYALGLDAPDYYTGKVPDGVFKTTPAELIS